MQSREELEQAAATWIAQRDSGAWDVAAFEEWLGRSAAHRAAYYRLNAAWTEAGRVRAPASERRPPRGLALFAAAATVLVVLGGTLVTFKDELFRTSHRFSTVVGGLQAIPMSDGSHVTLNTDSEISISVSPRKRVVEIEHGEAFFEVAHDTQRPFVVKAGDRRVVAVGTQFSVRREGADLRVIVSEGTVRYEGRSGDSRSLTAGTVVQTQGNTVRVEQLPVTEAERSLTWRNGVLTFRETPLAEAVAEFNRYNTRKIVIQDPTIARVEVGGVFRANNVDPFVRLLERGFGIRADIQSDQITLTASR